jgi:hypothetical protein
LLAQWAGSGSSSGVRETSPPPYLSLADRLSQWLGWADAIALSAALERRTHPATPSGASPSVLREELECQRVRQALSHSIAQDSVFEADSGRLPADAARGAVVAAPAVVDFAPYRQRYLARQQAMELALGRLRGRLRQTLAAQSPALAQLAAVDGVMAQVLGPQEHRLLATVPTLLERRFKRLREAPAATTTASEAAAQAAADSPAWLATFCQDMQAVLLAELDLRFQPVEGLLDALRTPQASPSP